MATPSLTGDIFLRETSYKAGSHVDSYHLMNMLKTAEPTDLGMIDLWAMYQKVQMPLYQFSSFSGKNTQYVDDPQGRFKWKMPVANDIAMIHSDLNPSNTTKGKDGHTFQIALNKRAFGHSEIITYDKFNGLNCIVTEAPVGGVDGKFIYTVRLINSDSNKTLSNDYLASGTYWFSLGSAINEHSERFNDLGDRSAGFREYYNFLPTAYANQHYSISSRADAMMKHGINIGDKGNINVTELWRYTDTANPLDPSIRDIPSMRALMGDPWMKKMLGNGTLTRGFVTAVESACLTKVGRDIENQLMWGSGGFTTSDGADDIRLSTGLWRQMDRGFKHIYNKDGFTLKLFQTEIFNFYNGRVDFKGPDPERELIVQTGIAGMQLVNEAIKREAVNSGLVINASEIGAITNKGMDLKYGFAYTQYVIPFLANVKFVLNPAFDNVEANNLENPIIDGYRLSSYSFIIFDITDNTKDNIYLMKDAFEPDLKWWYNNGDTDYMGRTSGYQGGGSFSGYRVFMKQRHAALKVMDPTKLLKIVMRNPINGSSL